MTSGIGRLQFVDLDDDDDDDDDDDARLEVVLRVWDVDLVHAYLVPGELLRGLSAAGHAVVAMLHNDRPGWPRGTASLRPGDAALLLG